MSADFIPHLHAFILAGGSGARLWPLSRELAPKQLLSVFGGESLIIQAVRRVSDLVASDSRHILTGETLAEEIRSHLATPPDIGPIEILAEPIARNTAPAIALAAAYAHRLDSRAIIFVLPSDHLLQGGPAWQNAVRDAATAADAGELVTIGLEPRSPETGFGYIKCSEPSGSPRALRVERFVEKPDAATARTFLEQGGYLWNSGMLVARADVVLAELRAASAEGAAIADAAIAVAALSPREWNSPDALNAFAALPRVPFDTAVLEVSDRVSVIPVDLDWSDVGSLIALKQLGTPDAGGNVLVGNTVDVDSHDVISYSSDRLVATLGLSDVIVVDTADATLVAARDRAQDVRLIVDALKATGACEAVESRTMSRPWGGWTLLMRTPEFQIKSIQVESGRRLSLQSHKHRAEHWVVVEGRATVERDGESVVLETNESTYIEAGVRHRLANNGESMLRIIEVAVGDYLGEDDIVRYEDDWGRGGD